MNPNYNKVKTFGLHKPKDNKRNKIIKSAIKKAVKDYHETFISLSNA